MARYTDQQLQDKILLELEWYENSSDTASIEQLLSFQDRVSIMSVNLARIAAKAKGTYLRAYFKRAISEGLYKGTYSIQGRISVIELVKQMPNHQSYKDFDIERGKEFAEILKETFNE